MPLLTVFALLVLTVITPSTSGAGLTNVPVLGDGGANFILDGGPWLASNGTLVVPSVVPGDLITDLHAAGRIRDPSSEPRGGMTLQCGRPRRGLSRDDSTYQTWMPWRQLPRCFSCSSHVKMAADVTLNGVLLGSCTNEHLRYAFDATSRPCSCGEQSLDKYPHC